MGKIRAHLEKRAKNEAYADLYRKQTEDDTEEQKAIKRRGGLYGKWCRTPGHPPECSCAYK